MLEQKISTYIVLVNHNSFEETVDCIRSVIEEERQTSFKIILIDNGSKEFDEHKIKKLFPDVETVKTEKNLGFSGGANIGIKMAMDDGVDYVLLLNNDTVVTKNFLGKLITTAKKTSAYGIIAPLITYYENPDLIWYRGGAFNKHLGLVRHPNMNKSKAGFDDEVFETEFITGCCMLIKREVFNKIGMLDEGYFLYNEDLDFCYRAVKSGYKLAVNPAAEILHKISASTNKSKNEACDPHRFTKTKAFYSSRNDLLFVKKNYRRLQGFTAVLGLFIIKFPYFILYLVRKKQFAELKAYLDGIRAGIIS